jgi:hypothetical protein
MRYGILWVEIPEQHKVFDDEDLKLLESFGY